jgi:hypothetical protein
MDPLRDTFKINNRKYDAAINVIREELGSFDSIAAQCYAHNGRTVSGNAIRRWFSHRSIPVEYAAVFSDLTVGLVGVEDFYPWLNKYFN